MGAANAGFGAQPKHKLLVVDDDENHCLALKLAFEKRGYLVRVAHCASEALCLAEDWQPGYALVDLRMPGPSGLTLIPRMRSASTGMRIVVLTGYASIATAVEATKLGAACYLTKPVDLAAVEAALQRDGADESGPPRAAALSVDRLAWEQIQKVLVEHDGHISATARSLGMHRRTLQRKLYKFPPRV
jgi:two-component system, response regulator RegA